MTTAVTLAFTILMVILFFFMVFIIGVIACDLGYDVYRKITKDRRL